MGSKGCTFERQGVDFWEAKAALLGSKGCTFSRKRGRKQGRLTFGKQKMHFWEALWGRLLGRQGIPLWEAGVLTFKKQGRTSGSMGLTFGKQGVDLWEMYHCIPCSCFVLVLILHVSCFVKKPA